MLKNEDVLVSIIKVKQTNLVQSPNIKLFCQKGISLDLKNLVCIKLNFIFQMRWKRVSFIAYKHLCFFLPFLFLSIKTLVDSVKWFSPFFSSEHSTWPHPNRLTRFRKLLVFSQRFVGKVGRSPPVEFLKQIKWGQKFRDAAL